MVSESSQRMKRDLDQVGSSLMRIGRNISLFVGVPLAAVGAAMLSLGSSAEQIEQKFDQVFGGMSDATRKWSIELSHAVGVSEFLTRETAAGLGAIIKGTGMASKEVADLSMVLTQVAFDLRAFNDVPLSQAITAVRSGMVGETESIKRLGIDIREEVLKEFAENAGFNLSDRGEKLKARTALIVEQTKLQTAFGQARREALQFSAQLVRAKGNLSDIGSILGQGLIPLLKPLLIGFNKLVEFLRPIVKAVASSRLLSGLVVMLGAFGIALGPLVGAAGLLLIGFNQLMFASRFLEDSMRRAAVAANAAAVRGGGSGAVVGFLPGQKALPGGKEKKLGFFARIGAAIGASVPGLSKFLGIMGKILKATMKMFFWLSAALLIWDAIRFVAGLFSNDAEKANAEKAKMSSSDGGPGGVGNSVSTSGIQAISSGTFSGVFAGGAPGGTQNKTGDALVAKKIDETNSILRTRLSPIAVAL